MSDLNELEVEIAHMEQESKNIDMWTNEINYFFQRNIFNRYLELKGNIRVFCRVKPVSLEDYKNEYQ